MNLYERLLRNTGGNHLCYADSWYMRMLKLDPGYTKRSIRSCAIKGNRGKKISVPEVKFIDHPSL